MEPQMIMTNRELLYATSYSKFQKSIIEIKVLQDDRQQITCKYISTYNNLGLIYKNLKGKGGFK